MNTLPLEAAATTSILPPSLRRLVLTGFMGAGKSTIGRQLAAEIGWTFLDLDDHLEQRAGLTVPQIFDRHGEEHFRRLESSALASALRLPHTVLALGGGAPETLTNRLLLEQTPGTVTIFLDAPFATLFDRCMLQDISRPVFADPAFAQQRFTLRHPLYRRIAHATVATADLTPDQTVPALLRELNKLS